MTRTKVLIVDDSAVVYGMPKEAVKLGAVDKELPGRIAYEIVSYGGTIARTVV
jgi:chemotaxis response regulator CheB